jgi:hypothetical protein
MKRHLLVAVALAAVLVLTLCGCEPAHKSARGFHLPDGDPARGHAAFVELRCHSCHAVQGAALPAPVADPPVPILLGGGTTTPWTDGEFVTAIVDPSHAIRTASPAGVQSGRMSRMGDFGEAMTVRQMVDIVAFLRAHTEYTPVVAAGH